MDIQYSHKSKIQSFPNNPIWLSIDEVVFKTIKGDIPENEWWLDPKYNLKLSIGDCYIYEGESIEVIAINNNNLNGNIFITFQYRNKKKEYELVTRQLKDFFTFIKNLNIR